MYTDPKTNIMTPQ